MKLTVIISLLLLISCSKNNVDLEYLKGTWDDVTTDMNTSGEITIDAKGNASGKLFINGQHKGDWEGSIRINGDKIFWNYDRSKLWGSENDDEPSIVIEKGEDYFITKENKTLMITKFKKVEKKKQFK